MKSLHGGVALLGLVLVAAAALAFALAATRWAAVLFAAGSWCVMACLLVTARATLREVRTVRSGLGRGRRQQNELATAAASTQAEHLRQVQRQVQLQGQTVAARVEEVADRLRQVGDVTGTAQGELRDRVQDLHGDLRGLAAEVTRLRDVPALAVWQRLAEQRREGVCCLLMGRGDAASILAADDSAAGFEVWDPAGGTGAAAPATPAHAVGAVLVDLDLVVAAADDRGELETFFRWLRPEVPVAGFTRAPGLLSLRAAGLSRMTAGVLLPLPLSADSMRFVRATGVPGAGDTRVPAGEGGTVRP